MAITADPDDTGILYSFSKYLNDLVERRERQRNVILEDVTIAKNALADSFSKRPYILKVEV